MRRSVDDEQRRVAEAAARRSISARCGAIVVAGARRHPVEHQRDRRAARPRGAQELPRHRVGVAGRGGDEQPQVGGGEQLLGEGPVGLHHRVDVGRVEQREARVERRVDATTRSVRASALGVAWCA